MSRNKFSRIFSIFSISMMLSLIIMSGQASALISQNSTTWFWTSDTSARAVAVGDVNGDGQKEIVTAGYYNDGLRYNAQLFVWNASNMALIRNTAWFWINNTQITSVAIGDVNGDNQQEIVTGGSYFDGTRWIAQLIVWNGTSLAAERITTWYWIGDTEISSVAVANVTGNVGLDIVTGGAYFDGTRWIAQLIDWNGVTLVAQKITTWFWTSNTYISSVAVANVTGGTSLDIITGGSFNDLTRDIAQLIVWNSTTMAAQKITAWYWTSNTYINSLSVANFTGGASLDIITAGSYNDGLRNNAQIIDWNSATMAPTSIATWLTTSNTQANSVTMANFGVTGNRIVAAGAFFDNIRENAQLTIWG
jgi:hypothetical protein